MKKFKKIFALICAVTLIVPINTAFAKEETYEYSENQYSTEITNVKTDNKSNTFTIVENDIDEIITIPESMSYVQVNGKYYDFEDYQEILQIQSQEIEKNVKVHAIVELAKNYTDIKNIDSFVHDEILEEVEPYLNNDVASTNAKYGKFYYIGRYTKHGVLVSLVSGAIAVLTSFFSAAFSGGITSGAVYTFVSGFLTNLGLTKLSTTIYYKKWQAIMNAKGTVKEKRRMGAESLDGSIFWDKKTYTKTFESQRPTI